MINNSNRISFVCFNCKEKNDSCVKGTGDCAFERDNYTNIFELMFKTKYINKWLPTNDMLYGFISSRLVIENVFPYISKAKYPTLSSMLKTTKFEDSMFGCVNPVKKENVSDDEIENIFVELYNLKSERRGSHPLHKIGIIVCYCIHHARKNLEQVVVIETTSFRWKRNILPLNYTCTIIFM